ncbi:hypothetical protein [Novosphingobium mangrovi (ex Huang et al. 2023)]|uniref:DUF3606 domain-containing protein n=1 Tax=Novosphingobium mangrovi (ex Huang et al. 2023) TaxID=2976432 RepID=A0ABT2I464_9SPHN|nr:hypothetical protein [Novosphingobium mangrovi (ex Huang et al. 2023)]MCT2399602.1 hypothetical protein [Novosphingobium mangrovi (ex Huang et al. 2023)]
MAKDEDRPDRSRVAANDNAGHVSPTEADAALTRIAEAIGRHIAREHIRKRREANDNDLGRQLPPADS